MEFNFLWFNYFCQTYSWINATAFLKFHYLSFEKYWLHWIRRNKKPKFLNLNNIVWDFFWVASGTPNQPCMHRANHAVNIFQLFSVCCCTGFFPCFLNIKKALWESKCYSFCYYCGCCKKPKTLTFLILFLAIKQ